MHFSIEHPAKVSKLVVVDIAPKRYEAGHDEIFEALSSFELSIINRRSEADELLAKKIPDVAVRQFLMKNLERNDEGKYQWKMNLPVLIREHENILGAIESTSPIYIPALFIRSAKSGYVSDGDVSLIQKIFPNAKIVTIEDAGHWVHADAPEDFLEVASKFFRHDER